MRHPWTNSLSAKSRDRFYYLLLSLTVLPSVVWIALDRFAWGGDQSQYGRAAVRLSAALFNMPRTWPSLMLDVFPMKPNALIWIGQWFVPFGRLFGSIDRALLMSLTLLQALTLVLIYRAVRRVAMPAPGIAAVACLVVSSAPLFIAQGQQYLAETVQTLSVAWFLLILTHAPEWSRAFLTVQLVAAGSFAFATKELQPLFCVGPGLVGLIYALRSPTKSAPGTAPRRTWLTAVVFLPLVITNFAWYLRNFGQVRQHLVAGAFGPGVSLFWGKVDTYPSTMAFWLDAAASHFFLPGVAFVWFGLLSWGAVAFFRRRLRPVSYFTVSAAVAGLQLVVILLVFSLSPTRQPRYLLPALPYVAFLAAWGLTQVGHSVVSGMAAVVFSCQLIVSHFQALSILPAGATLIRPLIQSKSSTAILQGIVDRTCRDVGPRGYLNVIAIHPSLPEMRGDWLAPDPLNYMVEKGRRRPDSVMPCEYGYLGDGFFGAPLDRAWASLVSRQARYIILVDPAVHPIPAIVFNQALTRETFPLVMNKVRTSGLFVQQPDLLQDPGILIFRRRMAGATKELFSRLIGRQLGDVNGRIECREDGILIHPGDSTPTLATFRLDGEIREIVVRLAIAPLDAPGKATPEAGNVNVTFLLDDKPLFEAYIDRTSVIEKTLSLSGRNLTVCVDNANGRSWWDWFLLTIPSMQ